jgi:Mrp family chromosome partitioning ATPase
MSLMLEALRKIEAKLPPPQQEREKAIEKKPLSQSAEKTDEQRPPPELLKEAISEPPVTLTAPSDVSAVEKTLAMVESSVNLALLLDEPDVYEQMAQYILTQITPGQPAFLLFTSPCDGVNKAETMYLLSKRLADYFHRDVFVLNVMQIESWLQNKNLPRNSIGWGHLFEQLKKEFQLALIDAPSLTDARTAPILSQCDGVYLVINLGRTTSYEVSEAVRVIRQAGGRLLGSIAVG